MRQDTAWYRVYLGHAWLNLAPGETRAIPLAYESLAGDPLYGSAFDANLETIYNEHHHVSIASSVVPAHSECGAPRRVFGCGLTLRAGLKLTIDDIAYDEEVISARVSMIRRGAREPLASGRFHVAVWPDDDPTDVETSSGPLRNGSASAPTPARTRQNIRDGRRVTIVATVPEGGDHIAGVIGPAPLNP